MVSVKCQSGIGLDIAALHGGFPGINANGRPLGRPFAQRVLGFPV
ncbi:MAG: hypothetical protein ACXVRQ_05355 [Gaiellaceae bacterium]